MGPTRPALTSARLLVAILVAIAAAQSASADPVHLRCEHLENPLGIDIAAPHFSWRSDNAGRNWRQSAYEIFVASSIEILRGEKPDVWDSGKIASADSIGIVYSGPNLEARRRYFWKVSVWDSNGQPSPWSAPAWWETGLVSRDAWTAKWISWKNPEDEADRAPMQWIWAPGQDAFDVPSNTIIAFRLEFDLRETPVRAALFAAVKGESTIAVNGHPVNSKKEWWAVDRQDLTPLLLAGKNTIEITEKVTPLQFWERRDPGKKGRPAGIAALIKVEEPDGSIARFPTDAHWQTRIGDTGDWMAAKEVAPLDDPRMGEPPGPLPQPAALLRDDFRVTKPVRVARLYVTALGSYCVSINGQRVGHDDFTPDFTDYSKRVSYQTYDVTALISNGGNTIGAILGDGWYGSSFTWTGQHFFPAPNRLLAQLEIGYADGSRDTIATNSSWMAAASPILRSDIYAGEEYDARLEKPGWDKPGFRDSGWASAVVDDTYTGTISSQISTPVRLTDTLAPKSVNELPGGAYVFDLGQNMVGWVTLHVSGHAGTRVRLRFAERLSPDGSIYTENLRNADATDVYVLRGGAKGAESFTPHFSFHGFRYVEVTGFPGKPSVNAISGEVLSSVDGEPSARISTSSELLDRMWSIGIWGQRGNFLSVPTDCPQRDERLGWMGDAGVFWRTGTYNFDIAAFSAKWMRDILDDQSSEGSYTNVAPDTLPGLTHHGAGVPGWGDAGVIVPYTTWLQYGDTETISDNWDGMQRWMDYIQRANPDFLRAHGNGFNLGDWLAPDQRTSKDLIATAYWAMTARMMSEMARAVGKNDEAKKYDDLAASIREAYQKAYITDSGEVESGTQAAYVLTLYMNLAPKSLEPAMMQNLVKDIDSRGGHLSTGFLATPFILFALADHGRPDVAFDLLLNETYPSWGYMLSKGATTWWERWNGDTGDPAMNSYNHYAFGSVVAWIYRSVAGIDTLPGGPGFRDIVIHPRLDDRITHARGEYDSVYGKIVSDWSGTAKGPFVLNVTVPANATATVFLPQISGAHVTEGGKPVSVESQEGANLVRIGSGTYEFRVK